MTTPTPPPTTTTTLILVCCHAIYLRPDRKWLLSPFQTSESPTFESHVRTGISLLSSTPNAILCFSGGATKRELTETSEARGYWDYADLEGLLDGEGIRGRVEREEWATDSFQNVLLSLVAWGGWVSVSGCNSEGDGGDGKARVEPTTPKKLVIVSHAFKKSRFLNLHIPAIRSLWETAGLQWDIREVEYIGIDPPFDEVKMAEVVEGDRLRGYGAWKDDAFGCGELLRKKRVERGWDVEKYLESVESWGGEGLVRKVGGMVE